MGVGNASLTCFDDRLDEDARKINSESTSQRFFPTFNQTKLGWNPKLMNSSAFFTPRRDEVN